MPEQESDYRPLHPITIVMGASAGGIDALSSVLSGLPADIPASILIVQHLSEDAKPTRLPEVLSRHTQLPICLAKDGMAIEAGRAYVAEPGKHLKINHHHLALDLGKPVRFVRPSVNVLFSSAARAFGPYVIAVLLTGIGSDGAKGCLDIKRSGGTIIVQNPATAAFSDMPEAAIKIHAADHILPLEVIPHKLMALVEAARD